MRIRTDAVWIALGFSLLLQAAFATAAWFLSGYWGTPIPCGDSGGRTFDLLGGFYQLFPPFFALDIALTAVPFYLLIHPLVPGGAGTSISLVLLAALVATGPVVLLAFGYEVNGTAQLVNAALAAITATVVGVVARRRQREV